MMPQKQVLTVVTVHVPGKNAEVPQAHSINKMVKVPVIMVTQLPFFYRSHRLGGGRIPVVQVC